MFWNIHIKIHEKIGAVIFSPAPGLAKSTGGEAYA